MGADVVFIDETVISVKAGDGGNGCFAYLREKYRPKGPPSGGNGGRGGHIYIQGSRQLHTLQDAAYRKSYKAERGQHGKGSNKYGKDGKSIYIHVPLGTLVMDKKTDEILYDCTDDREAYIVARGGRGGRGNASLATSRNRTPERSEPGKPGGQKELRLVLKVLADVGLVGRPNAGKSTMLSKVSRAHPKIADYPFTTTQPHLGIVKSADTYTSFVIADIPGLVEGAHEGKGMGHRFLRHIERTKVLAILVESLAESPEEDARVLIDELSRYSPILASKPKCHILTKCDLLPPEERATIPDGWLGISSATGEGLQEALHTFEKMLSSLEPED
ncbi:MAG: GTPase ObgE [Chitinivibrionales bacterium]|nr:GTPase ObgE [Chitinivibrionales bacterium]